MAIDASSFGLGLYGSPPYNGGWSPAPLFGVVRSSGTTVTSTPDIVNHPHTFWAYEQPKPTITNCKNCGAAFNRWDDDCNYCGTIR